MKRPIHTKFDIWACVLTLNNTTKNFRNRSTGFGTSHTSQIGNWGLDRPIHTKIYIKDFMLILNNTTKNYRHRSTGYGTSHMSQIGKLGS